MKDLKGDCSNVKLKEYKSEDICSSKSERMTEKNRKKCGEIGEVFGSGLRGCFVSGRPRSGPRRAIPVPD